MIGWILLLLLVVILFVLNRWTLWKARRAEALYPPVGQFVVIEGLRLHYLRRGSGPAVVLLHGSDGFLQDFAPTLDLLAQTCDVIAFDRPGHGYSDALADEALTSLVQARLIRGALCQLGVTRPVLVGHSWSGSLLMVYGLDYPDEVAGLVMLGGWVYASQRPYPLLNLPQIPLLGDFLLATLLTLVKGALIRWNLRQAFFPDTVPEIYARQAQAMWQRWPWQTRVFAQENTADRAVLQALQPRYASLTVPLILLTGDSDRVVKPEEHAFRLHAKIPGSEQIIVPQTGHEIPQTRPEAVRQAVVRCLEIASARPLPAAAISVVENPCDPFPHDAQEDRLAHARALVFRYGWNTTSYQILNPEMEHWFSSDGGAVIGYVTRQRVRIVAGAPVCDASRLPAVMVEFEQAAAQQGERVCYFCAASRVREALSLLPAHATVVIGAQPVWNPERWTEILAQNASLRQQVHRAHNKGLTVAEWPTERAHNNPALQRCLDEWMETHPLPPLHFLTEAVSLDRLADRRLFVAEIGGRPVGFLVLIPVPERDGWLVEQIARGHAAPNGTPAALIDAMMRTVAAEGSCYVTLGLAPLSRRAPAPVPRRLSWIRLLLAWVHAHGKRFYNFDGLDAFKAKFRPDCWEPLYAISNESHFSVRTLYAVAAAFSEDAPPIAVSRALLSAMRQEMQWFSERKADQQTLPR